MGPDIRELFRATNPGKTLFVDNREQDQKYYIDFSSVRGGQIIEDLKNNIALWSPEEPTCQLFTGHIGCGKSTELLRLKAELEEKGFHVVYYECQDLDMGDVDVGDILLAITHSISKSLEDVGIKLKASYFQKLFGEIKDILHTPMEISEVEFSVGIAKITSQAKESPKLRNKLRGYLEPRTDSILRGINKEFLEQGIKKLKQQGKNGLVVIADNLDRLFPTSKPWGRCQPEYLFVDRGSQLRGLHCHVVYTMPLALRFSNDYETLIQRFMSEPKILPMVPVQLRNGGSHTEGMVLLRQMVLARAFPELSSEQRLDKITKIIDSPETLDRHSRVRAIFKNQSTSRK